MAFAMLSTAIRRNPSATSTGAGRRPVPRAISSARAANFPATAPRSSGSSWFGPKTRGKNSGWSLPSSTLQSVTHSGPPRR